MVEYLLFVLNQKLTPDTNRCYKNVLTKCDENGCCKFVRIRKLIE